MSSRPATTGTSIPHIKPKTFSGIVWKKNDVIQNSINHNNKKRNDTLVTIF